MARGLTSTGVVFHQPGEVRLSEEPVGEPAQGEVLVRAEYSAISLGTEMVVYRGQFPAGMPLDSSISGMSGEISYPLRYGYSLVGVVEEAGAGTERGLPGRRVFCFHPHESRFIADASEIVLLPPEMDPRDAVFLATMESALNLVMDARPLAQEKILVLGQGMVGILVTALLARFPLALLATADLSRTRRRASRNAGAHESLDPADPDYLSRLTDLTRDTKGFDLAMELTGEPKVLDTAIAALGFSGRVLAGSFYGSKQAPVDLGGHFHRDRITIRSSQVSTVAPELTGRWDKKRRLAAALNLIRDIRPSRFVTATLPLDKAPETYEALESDPGTQLQVLFSY